MRILILEDEPIIAFDLEDIVSSNLDAECLLASNLDEGLELIDSGIDFALLDVSLGDSGETSLPIAAQLIQRRIPFCFVSASLGSLPASYRHVPQVSKPFRPNEVTRVLPLAA
ncbi:response regulator [Mangrovibrevibacter kandeliae]|uniref:response regulator n=1 Tax=Mangrovibrevibacter kandeliae TaxID=2968473 RepID=UPI0021179DB0|nr:response regulator [Aurantimonas sp. CSK15Z-1]MCQ8781310.1 response regulator [Aurantimonas sp. CSK15Z-1]